jgi:hypothetical protein
LNITRRSRDIDSGIVRIRSYPRAAATMASAMPVLPAVGGRGVEGFGVEGLGCVRKDLRL